MGFLGRLLGEKVSPLLFPLSHYAHLHSLVLKDSPVMLSEPKRSGRS
jgi:hypothetical protein